jgi:hypothetical protein
MNLAMLILGSPLTPLEHGLRHVLDWLNGSVGLTWAWSIVALTVIVRTILVPLTVRQIHSMQALQRHAPQMKEIQKKYKADKQKQNEELMKFYRENNINPAASCLPMLLQLPVFIALYYRSHFARGPRPCTRTSRGAPHSVDHDPTTALGRVRARLRGGQWRRRSTCRRPRQDAAHDLHAHAARVRLRDRALPGGSRSLLGDDEPLDGRAGADHEAADAEDARPVALREEELANAAT